MEQNTAISFIIGLGQSPILLGFVIFLISLIESLAIVGIIVPGMFFMLLLGAYLSTGEFSFFIAVLLTFLGAIVGDTISYYIGRHYQSRLIKIWPINRYANSFEKGIHFFKRHGNKSIIFGRFIGPIRPFIPAIAGMFEMPRSQFFTSNIISALIWAPAILLPGYIIGLSFEYANELATRIIILLIVIIVLIMSLFWLTNYLYTKLILYLNFLAELFLNTGQKRASLIAHQDRSFTDKKITIGLIIFYLINSIILLFTLNILSGYNNIDDLFDPALILVRDTINWYIITSIIRLSNIYWLIFLTSLTATLLFWKGYITLFKYYILTLAFLTLFQFITIIFFSMDLNYYIFTTFIYVFIIYLLSLNSNRIFKYLYFITASLFLIIILFVQLNSNTAKFHELIIITVFVLLIILILSVFYQYHNSPLKTKLSYKFALTFLLINIIYINSISSQNISNNISPEISIISDITWKKDYWLFLLESKENDSLHIRNIQWQASRNTIVKKMTHKSNREKQWQLNNSFEVKNLLQYLNPQADIQSLYITPQVYQGKYETLQFTQLQSTHDDSYKLLVLRLWKTNVKVRNNNSTTIEQPLWQGNITKVVKRVQYGFAQLKSETISNELLINTTQNIQPDVEIKNYQNFTVILLPENNN